MAAATLKNRSAKMNGQKPSVREPLEEDRSASFFMPTMGMTLEAFRAWTYSDEFPRTGSIAYIGKEIFIDMSPERLQSHGSVKTAVSGTIIPLVFRKKKGKLYFDRTRVVNVAAGLSNEPDGVFALWESFKNGKIILVPTKDDDDYIELEGTPDWILEVVSRSSVTKDKKTLRKRYHRAGISEYWLIDARGDEVEFDILIHGEDDYEPAQRAAGWQVSRVFGKKFRLRRIKDELGDVDYRLDVK
ncbi:MAG: Uma2 family endonuclease [Planctomycetes bacterium]|nr:Uma2 family endonuclease [Planctomycetota bacterium]